MLVVTMVGTLLTGVPSPGVVVAVTSIVATGTGVGWMIGVAIGNTGGAIGTVSVARETGDAITFTFGLFLEYGLPFLTRTVFECACLRSLLPFLKLLFPGYATTF